METVTKQMKNLDRGLDAVTQYVNTDTRPV